jgi:diguanylate cyclase (GGDEF)-like protein/PAS domain S-box-containing protein
VDPSPLPHGETERAEKLRRLPIDAWREILDALPIAVFVLDRDGMPFYANRKSEELLAQSLVDAAPHDLPRVYPTFIAGTNEPYPPERLPIIRALGGERAQANDLEVRTATGTRTLEVIAIPATNEQGEVEFAVAAFSDITDRVRLERLVKLLQSVAIAANEASTLHDALQVGLDLVCEIAGWPLGHCWVVAPESAGEGAGATLVSSSIWHNAGAADLAQFVRLTGRMQVKFGEGWPGRVAETAEPAWILDTQNDLQFARSHPVPAPGVRAAFAFPVLVGREVYAVLEFFAAEPREPDRDLIEVMRHVGRQLGRVVQRVRAEETVAESERQYRDLIENSLDPICMHDLQGRLLMINRAAVENLGYDSADELIGMNLADLVHPSVREGFGQYMSRMISEGRDEGLMTVVRRDGEKRVWEYRNTLRYMPGSQIVRGVARDVTDRLRAENMIAESEARYRLLFERNLAGVCRTTSSGEMLDVNDAFVHLFGYDSRDEVLRANAADLYPDADSRREYLKRLTASGSLANIESRLRRKDGSLFWALMSATLVHDRRHADALIEATLIDITSRKEAEERNAFQATHDLLTGLPNRMLFNDRLHQAIAAADRQRTRLAVGFIDLDHFKPISDEFGHAGGDAALHEIASRIQSAIRQSDTVARVGGDAFVVLLAAIGDRDDATSVFTQIASAIDEPIAFAGREVIVEASIGVSLFPDDATDADTLVRLADQAMYRTKIVNRSLVPPRSD